MKLMTFAVGAAVGALALAGSSHAAPGDKIPGRYICVFKSGVVAKGNVRAEANRAASNAGGQADRFYENTIRGFAASMSDVAARNMARNNRSIAYCEQDQEVGIGQSALEFRVLGRPAPQPAGQKTPWGVTKVGGPGTPTGVAWIIDSGIDLDHPDLNVDVARSRNFVARETSADDLNGHGSHVAGTIAAKNDAYGVVGVAAGASVVAVRVLDRRGSGSNSGVIQGVDYVAGAASANDVANMSLGGGVSSALDAAVVAASAKVRFTLAAGNESEDANLHSPARANGSNIFTVSSFTSSGALSSFSNHGNPPIDWAEPGSSIPSTYKDGGYATLSGTSMAAPHLAGLLISGGVRQDGTITGDRDSTPDKIGVR